MQNNWVIRQVRNADIPPAPGFQSLHDDPVLHEYRRRIEISRPKNHNIADRAVQELSLEGELLKLDPTGDPVTPVQLTIAVHNLNARLRGRGVSSRKMWSQRDQFTNSQLPLEDNKLITDQLEPPTQCRVQKLLVAPWLLNLTYTSMIWSIYM